MTVACEPESLTVVALAAHYGVSRQTIYNWRDAGCPIGAGLPEIDAWLDANRSPELSGLDLKEAKLRGQVFKLQEEIREKRLDNDKKEGLLYEAKLVEQNVAELTGMIRHRMETIADELETEWPPEVRQVVTERLRDKIHLILTEMSQWRMET